MKTHLNQPYVPKRLKISNQAAIMVFLVGIGFSFVSGLATLIILSGSSQPFSEMLPVLFLWGIALGLLTWSKKRALTTITIDGLGIATRYFKSNTLIGYHEFDRFVLSRQPNYQLSLFKANRLLIEISFSTYDELATCLLLIKANAPHLTSEVDQVLPEEKQLAWLTAQQKIFNLHQKITNKTAVELFFYTFKQVSFWVIALSLVFFALCFFSGTLAIEDSWFLFLLISIIGLLCFVLLFLIRKQIVDKFRN